MSQHHRGSFSNIGFILAAAGSAVGLGNIWRFPYLAGQSGGAIFLIFYLLCVFTLCFPVMIGEIAIGRNARSDAYGSYRKLGGGHWGYLGLFGIITGVFILSFYNVVSGWAFGYFLEISFGNLLNEADFGAYFGNYVTDISDNVWFSLGFMILTAIIVAQGVQKGIEAASKIMMPSLYFILLCLIVYSLTLPNAIEGVKFYLIPDFGKMNIETIFNGLRQAFFSLSLGMGTLMTYGSYMEKKQNLISSTASIAIADTSVAFLAGLMIFPLVFSQGVEPTQGPPLVFIILPKIFHAMGPILGRVVGGSFFLLLCFAALTSTISLLEVPAAYLVDQKKMPRKRVTWLTALLIFVVGLPSMLSQGNVEFLTHLSFYKGKSFLDLVQELCDISLTLGGCLMCVFIIYRWKIGNLDEEIAHGNEGYANSFMRKYLHVMIGYVGPIILGIMSLLIITHYFYGLDKLFGWDLK